MKNLKLWLGILVVVLAVCVGIALFVRDRDRKVNLEDARLRALAFQKHRMEGTAQILWVLHNNRGNGKEVAQGISEAAVA
ncbi:MAG: hypothetical protein IT463_11300, partial [Planctomycetes bacterium]|nr:hypothetical protein [Planctomycetota bacterium]